jgi:hypothetical protein
VTLYYYSVNGGSLGALSRSVGPHATWRPSQTGQLQGQAGSAKIVSNQPLAVVVNEAGPNGNGIGYSGTP